MSNGNSNSNSLAGGIAVVDATTIRLDNGITIARTDTLGAVTIASLLAACRRRQLAQLWIHPTTFIHLEYEERGAWDIQPDPLKEPNAGRYVALERGTYGRVTLLLPGAKHLRQRAPALAATRDGHELLSALRLLNTLLGVTYDHSPGSTAIYLLRHLHSKAARARIPLDPIAEFPEPARHTPADSALVWARPLADEEKARRYIHSYDRNGAWLASASSLACGVGAPVHVTDAADLLDGGLVKRPGYWRLTESAADLLTRRPQWLPTLVSALPTPRRRTPVWVTTPTIRLICELAGGEQANELPADFVREAWLWPEHHQLLQPWYKRMRDARVTLVDLWARDVPGAAVALATLKEMYTRFFAWLKLNAPDYDRPDNPLHRPDIRHAVIAAGRTHLLRTVYALAREAGVHVWGVSTDAFYITSDEADPAAALCGQLCLSETQLGAYRAKDVAVPLAEALAVMDCAEPGSKPDLMAFQMWRNGTLTLPTEKGADDATC